MRNTTELYLVHHGIKGQKWGVRRYQNSDGTLTAAGKVRYGVNSVAEVGLRRVQRRKMYNTAMKNAKAANKKAAKDSSTISGKLSNTIGPKARARKRKAYEDYNNRYLSKSGKKEVTKRDRQLDFAKTFAYTMGKEIGVRILTKQLKDTGHPIAALAVRQVYKKHSKPISDGEKAAKAIMMGYDTVKTVRTGIKVAKTVRQMAKPYVDAHNERVRKQAEEEGLNYYNPAEERRTAREEKRREREERRRRPAGSSPYTRYASSYNKTTR